MGVGRNYKHQVIYLLLLAHYGAHADDSTTTPNPPDKLVLRKAAPYPKQEPGFMSRIASWLYPFGATQDSIGAEDHYGGHQYLPPPNQQHGSGCNPCNNEPWVPIASHQGHNTIVNFVPPSSQYGPPRDQYGPPSPQYGPPQIQSGPPQSQYGPPQSQFGPPQIQNGPPQSQYGPPQIQDGPPQSQYGPPQIQFGPPQDPQGSFQNQYVPPVHQDRYVPPELRPPLPPPSNQHVAPSQIAPHSVKPIFNRPPKQQRPFPNLYPVDNMKPPPERHQVTHLRPVGQGSYVPFGMNPPPLSGPYRSLPASNSDSFGEPPPPPPSDSYGTPIRGPNIDYQRRPEFLPDLNGVPLPVLSTGPVLPIHQQQDFRQQYHPSEAVHSGTSADVQIVPSVKVADFLSSIDHPINVIQSPLLDVNVNLEEANNGGFHGNPGKFNDNLQEGNKEEFYVNRGKLNDNLQDGNKEGFYGNQGKLNENPIVVEDDTHVAATVQNVSTISESADYSTKYRSQNQDDLHASFIKQILEGEVFTNEGRDALNKSTFTPPPMDYGRWEPSLGGSLSSSMVPPPLVGPSTWLHSEKQTTTNKPKQFQIIIPYISDKKPSTLEGGTNVDNNQGRKVPAHYSTLLPVYSPPSSTEESLWTKFAQDFDLAASNKVTATAFTVSPPTKSTTQVSNIRDLLYGSLGDRDYANQNKKLPFDVVLLQNNIDDWTQEEFSKRLNSYGKSSTVAKLVPSKKIPNEYFTTQPYNVETTTAVNDYEQAGSNYKETKIVGDDNIESNLVLSETSTIVEEILTTEATTSASTKNDEWNSSIVTVSPITKEKVYIVTPSPYNHNTPTPKTAWISLPPKIGKSLKANSTTSVKFTVRVDPDDETSRNKLAEDSKSPLTVVFSEWPHLINNLQTTTVKPTSRHPLMGLMDLPSYTPPPNSTVQTFSGHSKVATVVTPTAIPKKKTTPINFKEKTILKIVTPVPSSHKH